MPEADWVENGEIGGGTDDVLLYKGFSFFFLNKVIPIVNLIFDDLILKYSNHSSYELYSSLL